MQNKGCSFLTTKRSRDIHDFKYTCRHIWKNIDRFVYESESGVYFPIKEIRVAPVFAKSLGFWIHEFSECAIIEILDKWDFDWNAKFKPKGFGSTFIAHFITPLGENNGLTLDPALRTNRPKW